MLYRFTFGYREITPQPAELGPLQRRNSYAMFDLFKHKENTPTPAESGFRRRNTIAIGNPFKRQKTTLTSAHPDGIQRRIMSNELVEEWFNASQHSYGSRISVRGNRQWNWHGSSILDERRQWHAVVCIEEGLRRYGVEFELWRNLRDAWGDALFPRWFVGSKFDETTFHWSIGLGL
jgi:hypothetical protein